MPPPLRVAFFATCFPRPAGERIGPWALRQAQALLRNGCEVLVVSMTPYVPKMLAGVGPARKWAECPPEYYFGPLRVLYPRWLYYQRGRLKRWDFVRPALQHHIAWCSAAAQIRRIVRDFRPDIVYAHHSWVSGDVARRLKRDLHLPYVITDHDFEEIAECERFPARLRFIDRVMRGASMMTPVAHAMERDINQLFPGVPTQTVHNGADPIPASLVQNPRPPDLAGKKIIFSAGGFFNRKGIPLLVEAFGKIAARHPDALLRIAGDGPERPEIEAAIVRTGAGDRITLLGAVPHERVLQEMVWCDLFALIGWMEPFATVYLEALAAGRPIVCCNDGGINDVIQNEVHALTVPPKDIDVAAAALDRLLTDENARLRMGSAARELFDTRMSWDARARAMIDVFERVLHRTPAERGAARAPDSPDAGISATASVS